MNDDFEGRLRASLARHAEQAPPAGLLAERIVHATARTDGAPAPRRWGWRTFALPLLAAGAVGAVVGGAFAVQSLTSHTASPPGPTAGHSAPAVSQGVTAAPTVSTSATPITTSDLRDVQIVDLTFAGTDDGWALASSNCIKTSGRCTAMLRTTDGKTWTSMPNGPFNVPGVKNCAAPCVYHLRFATDQIGYAFGPAALYMTVDGGQHWKQQAGGALYLETLNENVIKVSSPHSGCPSWCDVQVTTAPVGGTTWTAASLGAAGGFGVQLVRGGHNAYLLSFGHPSGGARGDGTSQLFRSSDDGRTWTKGGEPCPQINGEVDSYAVAAGGENRVSVLCAPRMDSERYFVATSTDGGAHFAATSGGLSASAAGPWVPMDPGEFVSQFSGDPATVLVSGGGSRIAVSTNGGASWMTPAQPTGKVTWLGFESNTVGRVVTGNRTIWTTRNAGTTWTAVTLP